MIFHPMLLAIYSEVADKYVAKNDIQNNTVCTSGGAD